MKKPFCNKCNKESRLTTGEAVHPHSEEKRGVSFYECESCDAVVECIKGTTVPKGTLAGFRLQQMRRDVVRAAQDIHLASSMTKGEVGCWLMSQMRCKDKDFNVYVFDEGMCEMALVIAKRYLRKRRDLEDNPLPFFARAGFALSVFIDNIKQ